MRYPLLVAAATLVACGTPKPNADSAAVAQTIDTVKAAPPGAMSADSMRAAQDSAASKATTPTGGTKRIPSGTTKAQTPDTHHLGRDSVIRTNPRDPRRQLPTVPPKPDSGRP